MVELIEKLPIHITPDQHSPGRENSVTEPNKRPDVCIVENHIAYLSPIGIRELKMFGEKSGHCNLYKKGMVGRAQFKVWR